MLSENEQSIQWFIDKTENAIVNGKSLIHPYKVDDLLEAPITFIKTISCMMRHTQRQAFIITNPVNSAHYDNDEVISRLHDLVDRNIDTTILFTMGAQLTRLEQEFVNRSSYHSNLKVSYANSEQLELLKSGSKYYHGNNVQNLACFGHFDENKYILEYSQAQLTVNCGVNFGETDEYLKALKLATLSIGK